MKKAKHYWRAIPCQVYRANAIPEDWDFLDKPTILTDRNGKVLLKELPNATA
ncbi:MULTISPECIES: hypothetical protein [unclassified Roseobacter]|uniref:hypothetical protein n=1 Tax=unclassified Roseobacter TaxID=196798 RepID=UPI0014926E61|nr:MULTISPECIES: hypothetical protein [unclassified Roseobacter]NNW55463.1 hypothetical protein [Roseobacter sp. HKCCD8284]NNY17296.1 hypothetical protein [Roseobacter sp. HKCCD8191]